MSDVTTLPVDQSVDFDLDAEVESYEPRPPFRTRVGGRVISFVDPQSLDWRDVMFYEQPSDLIKGAVTDEEERKHFLEQSLPAKALGALANAFLDHFKFREQYEESQRQGRLSQVGGR